MDLTLMKITEGASKAPRKKRKVRKNQEPNHSGSKDTLSPTSLHHAAPENVKETATATPAGPIEDTTSIEKEVVDLSGNTRMSTPPATTTQPSPHPEHTASDVIIMDAFLKLPVWTRTVVSKGDPIPEDQSPKLHTTPPLAVRKPIPEKSSFKKNFEKPNSNIAAAREKKEQQNLVKLQAKRAREGASKAPRKKRKVRKNQEPNHSGSKDTLSPTSLHHAAPYLGLLYYRPAPDVDKPWSADTCTTNDREEDVVAQQI
nr:hypothetical protein [Tanacetum cinerariifolium]